MSPFAQSVADSSAFPTVFLSPPGIIQVAIVLLCVLKNLQWPSWKDKTGRKLLLNYNPYATRLKTTADAWVTRATLVISGVTESDSGLYFCGTKSDAPEMFFDKPIRLEIEGNRFQFFTSYLHKLCI